MLQQTRVAAVLPRYEAFLSRYPDPASLARADEEEVLASWSGLGYYGRARRLHAAARAIVDGHDGEVPSEVEGLRALPGVGAYTAGAVLSIAFGRPEPVVDGNVERVLSRALLIEGNVKRGEARKRLWECARGLVREGPPDRVNQALMELGALVCLPGSPRCSDCPIEDRCAARARGIEERLPELPEKRKPVSVTLSLGLARRGAEVLLARAPEGGFLAGTWGPPFTTVEDGADPASALARADAVHHGLDLDVGRLLGTVRHAITHHRITARCHLVQSGRDPDGERARWVDEADLDSYCLSSLAAKSLRLQLV
jgi:A/G-specific adenine glycosylase